jgi:hypothetical protein
MRNYTKIALAVAGLSIALQGGNALAATPTTLTGTTVSYSFDADDLGLFGAASLSGDELVFTPANFTATSVNGSAGAAFQTLHITVSANSGFQLSAVNLAESGAYSLTGGASAFVTGNITALDIEGTTSAQEIGTIATTESTDVVGSATGWTANAGVVVPATGWGGTDGVVNSIGLKITNQLFATSVAGSSAEVWKNAASLTVVTSPVPEAETYAMLLAGLGLVGFMARRRSLSVI